MHKFSSSLTNIGRNSTKGDFSQTTFTKCNLLAFGTSLINASSWYPGLCWSSTSSFFCSRPDHCLNWDHRIWQIFFWTTRIIVDNFVCFYLRTKYSYARNLKIRRYVSHANRWKRNERNQRYCLFTRNKFLTMWLTVSFIAQSFHIFISVFCRGFWCNVVVYLLQMFVVQSVA